MDSLTLRLKPAVRLLEDAGRLAGLEEPGSKRLRLSGGGEAQQALLRALARGARAEEELCGLGAHRAERLELRYLLALLEQEGWICYDLEQDGRVLASLEPLTRDLRFQPAGDGFWRLSRFAWIRRFDGGAALENPLGFGRVLLCEPRAMALVGLLSRPQTPDGLAAGSGLAPPVAAAFLSLLSSAGAVAPFGAEGQLPEDRDPALRQWEFHDLLFHSRSRAGRHGDPAGGTLRFLGEIAPLPALKPVRPEGIPLPEPCLPLGDPPFFQVLEARRSIRSPGPEPITLAQLGTFLHYVARVRGIRAAGSGPGQEYEAVYGPCPAGGGLHEIELYLTVARCAGLQPGFYHYAAGCHALERLPDSPAAGRMLLQAAAAMGSESAPDILFTLAARIQRVTWKYQTIGYSLILKNTGVLYQQMYLVATALGLAPCAIGAGDIQLFAQASGLDATRESSVGEFALSGGQPT
jgi:SagB-type dehydrogenase family enzyme